MIFKHQTRHERGLALEVGVFRVDIGEFDRHHVFHLHQKCPNYISCNDYKGGILGHVIEPGLCYVSTASYHGSSRRKALAQ